MTVATKDQLASLVRGVSVLSLDAGGTVIFLDHARVARFCKGRGINVTPAQLIVAEGEAKRRLETEGSMVDAPFAYHGEPGGAGWGRMIGTSLHVAGVPKKLLGTLLDGLWREHVQRNLWSLVPAGLGHALDAVRARGVRVVVVSNSEGMLERLFDDLGLLSHLDRVVDSGVVGVEKPDPRIFGLALDGTPPEAALHLGDTFATDVLGAREAGLRSALIDEAGHYAGLHAEVLRVRSVVEVCDALRGV